MKKNNLEQFKQKLTSIKEFKNIESWKFTKIKEGIISPHTYKALKKKKIYFIKETTPHESHILKALIKIKSKLIPKIVHPELLDKNILVYVWINGTTMKIKKLKSELIINYAKMQNNLNGSKNNRQLNRYSLNKPLSCDDGYYKKSFLGDLDNKNLLRLKKEYNLKILDNYLKIYDKIKKNKAVIVEVFTKMPFARLHNDFKENNIIGDKLIDWGSSYGHGPFIRDLAPFLINDKQGLEIFKKYSNICKKSSDKKIKNWLYASLVSRFIELLKNRLYDGNENFSNKKECNEFLRREYKKYEKLLDFDFEKIKTQIYPKNKEHFKKLIPFAQKIISLCRDVGINPVIYGSYAHFVHTRDESMQVNDIDLWIPEKKYPTIIKLLEINRIKYKYYPKWHTLIIEKGTLKVELDSLDYYCRDLNKKPYPKKFDTIDFYGNEMKVMKLDILEKFYEVALAESDETKEKVRSRIEDLERFLKRKLVWNKPTVEITKNKDLSKLQKETINKTRIKEWGKGEKKDFTKDFEPNTLWFFVKEKNKVVSLGGIRPIRVKYAGKTYSIGGICSTISLVKEKGYGKIMVSAMTDYSKKTGKTILGFTGQTNFFKKAELGIKKDFIRRFIWVKPGGKRFYDDDGDGIYYEGKDKFVSKVLKGKSPVYINVEHW
jgi:hypothetical protein